LHGQPKARKAHRDKKPASLQHSLSTASSTCACAHVPMCMRALTSCASLCVLHGTYLGCECRSNVSDALGPRAWPSYLHGVLHAAPACGTVRGHQAHALARGPITSLLGLYSLQKASQLAKLGMCQQHAEFRMASCGQHPCALYYKPACRGSCATDDAPSLQDTGQKLPRMLRVQSHAHNIYPSICLSISSPSLPMHLQNIARKRPAALCVAGTRALREGARKRTIS
jgi:hypothetical protein